MPTTEIPTVHISEVAHDRGMLIKARHMMRRHIPVWLVEKTFLDGTLAGMTIAEVFGGSFPPKLGAVIAPIHGGTFRWTRVVRLTMD